MNAADLDRGLVIVPAGAGAGKTHRIKTQLSDWVKRKIVRPERILAVTFTEAAAGELRERIRAGLLADGLVAEAVRSRDLNAAKLADTVCRTIANKQKGERVSWGLEAGEGDQKITVVVERE